MTCHICACAVVPDPYEREPNSGIAREACFGTPDAKGSRRSTLEEDRGGNPLPQEPRRLCYFRPRPSTTRPMSASNPWLVLGSSIPVRPRCLGFLSPKQKLQTGCDGVTGAHLPQDALHPLVWMK